MNSLKPIISRQDRRANILIWTTSTVIFIAVFALSKYRLKVHLGFDIHIFATANAIINGLVSLLLVYGLFLARGRKFTRHRNVMIAAIILSILFLVSYVCHHLFSGSTVYEGRGFLRYVYFFILITHIFFAGIVLPFILYTAYRALTAQYKSHIKLARLTFPIWLYVSITGVIVYLLINPYYR